MMTIIILSFLSGYPVLALFGVPVFLTALMGIDFELDKLFAFRARSKETDGISKYYPNNEKRWNFDRASINNLGYNITKIFQVSNNN